MGYVLLLALLAAFNQGDVPLLPADAFSYEMEYFLKKKDRVTESTYDIQDEYRNTSDMLPFVKINFTFSSFEDGDRRFKIYQGEKLLNTKRIRGPMILNLEMGFTEDLKEGVLPPVFEIFIIDDNKEKRARIKVEVKPNGELLINEVVSGMI